MPVHKNRYFPEWDEANKILVKIMQAMKPQVLWDGEAFDITVFPPQVIYMIPPQFEGRFNLCWKHFWGIISKNIDYGELDRIYWGSKRKGETVAYIELAIEKYIGSVMPKNAKMLFCLMFGLPITVLLYENGKYIARVSSEDMRVGGEDEVKSK